MSAARRKCRRSLFAGCFRSRILAKEKLLLEVSISQKKIPLETSLEAGLKRRFIIIVLGFEIIIEMTAGKEEEAEEEQMQQHKRAGIFFFFFLLFNFLLFQLFL